MALQQHQPIDDIRKIFEALIIDLPAAAIARVTGRTSQSERGLSDAGWKAYDASARLIAEATNQLYASPRFGMFAASSLEGYLSWRQFAGAVNDVIAEAAHRSLGFATADQINELSAQVEAIRDQLAAPAERHAKGRDAVAPRHPATAHRSATLEKAA